MIKAFAPALAFAGLVHGCAAPAPPQPRAGGATYPWVSDQGNGSYRNPILFADYSDPDAIRVAGDYYLVASSFTSTPALPILKSRDLVNWTIVGHALENLPDPRYADFQPGAGVWAPSLRQHAGLFYLFVPLPDEGIYVQSAVRPEGPWSAPRLLLAGRGLIDPCPFWDDDGRAYLIHAYAGSRAGIKDRLRIRPMAPDASQLLGEGQIVYWDPVRHPTLEGPKLYKHNQWYVILAPAGGVPRGWQVALRSRHIFGPYEDRIVLAQGRTSVNGPHQGALVDTPSGEWWFIHFQDTGLYGRVVHLNPVTWTDDWPVMGVAGRHDADREPVLVHRKPDLPVQPIGSPQTTDEFDGPDGRLGPQWQWHANHGPGWDDLRTRPGWLRLTARPLPERGLAAAPHLLLQKLPARSFTAETAVDLREARSREARSGEVGPPGPAAGLIVVGQNYAALTVERAPGPASRQVILRMDDRIAFTAPVGDGTIRLSVTMADGGACRFRFAVAGGREQSVAASFTARPGRWVGAQIGLFAADLRSSIPPGETAFVDFDYLRFSPARSP
jgi:hypothetical protein